MELLSFWPHPGIASDGPSSFVARSVLPRGVNMALVNIPLLGGRENGTLNQGIDRRRVTGVVFSPRG